MRYYIQEQNHVAGPYSLEEIQAKIQRGEMQATDSVCAEGTNVWTPLPAPGGAPPLPPYAGAAPLPPGPAPAASAPGAAPIPPKKKGGGCCGCLLTGFIVCVALIVALCASSYYIILYTPIPLRWVASQMNGNPSIQGISGSLASGYSVQSIQWHGQDGQMCDMEDLRFKYNGLSEFGRTKSLIISEINVGKAHLVISSTSSTASYNDGQGSSSHRQSGNGLDSIKLFRIDRVHVGDVYFKDLRTGVEFSMPALDYTGFQVKDGKVDLGSLQLQSDRLDLQTSPGSTVQIDGKPVEFQKHLAGTAKPLLSKAIKKPITFALDVGLTPKHEAYFHVAGFDNKVDFYSAADHSSHVQVKGLPFANYLSIAPYDAPIKATIDVRSPAPSSDAKQAPSVKGDFILGATRFVIDPLGDPREGDRVDLTATGHAGSDQLIAAVTLHSSEPQVKFAFRSIPEMPPKDLLAKIFFAKPYEELAEGEQKQVDAKMAVYFKAESEK